MIGRPAFGLLGGHVFHGAQHAARPREPPFAKQACDAEIREFHAPVGGQQDVARLDVAMHDAPIVSMAQRRAHRHADRNHLAPVEVPPASQFLLQTDAVDQFHHVVGLALLLAVSNQAHDARVVQLA